MPDRITRDAVTVSKETLLVKVETNNGATGFVLDAGVYYYLGPTPLVDSKLYEISGHETADERMIYIVSKNKNVQVYINCSRIKPIHNILSDGK